MSNRFTQQAVASFLTENGCDADKATFISTFVVTALRSVSIHAEISNQNVNEDFTAYSVAVAANGGAGFTVDYSVSRLGPGFFDHRAKVKTPDVEYTVTRLVHETVAEEAVAPEATPEAVVVLPEATPDATPEATPEVTPEPTPVAEEPVALAVESDWAAEVVEAINEEIVDQLVAAAPEAEVVADAPAEATEEAPKAKKGKAKKAK